MPYFMQPKALHACYHKFECKNLDSPRRIRLGFYGTHNPVYYTEHFRFPISPRTPILERFIEKFHEEFYTVTAENSDHIKVQIAVSLDDGRGDVVAKKFLPQEKYFRVLEATDFMLCPPGWCMPLAHNIVESMSRGVIPILNYAGYMVPPLVDGINCLAFSSLDEMEQRVREALAMPKSQVQELRFNAVKYYLENLKPGNWWKLLLLNSKVETTILVNNEEESVGIMEPDFLEAAADYIAKHQFK
jgi:glycosyltransferase involved in cell wall biosynthesis